MPDLNDLSFFVSVVSNGGFSAAARALGVPKSRISRRIAALEAQLGVRLVERSTRRFKVTEVGHDVFRHARAAIAEAEAIDEVVSRLRVEPQGLVRISCPVGTDRLLASCLPHFLAEHPKLRLQFLVTNRRVDLIEEGVDIAIRVRQQLDTDAELQVKIIGRTGSVLVASPALLAAHGTPGGPEDLAAYPTLGFSDRQGPDRWLLTSQTGQSTEVAHEPRLTASAFPMLRQAAIDGLGVALLPEYACRELVEDQRLVRVLPQWAAPEGILHLVFTSRRGLLPSVRATLDFIALALRSDSPAWRTDGAALL
ncbi:LysR family transcriptional regulator [Phenylobacterium terrae]|uniref:LysR family transcriptional regulator n=1 Tax=Phenylobacterium terrae TaxID=2665495 RepID=A0ABW4N7K8_9CAUL